MNWDEYFMLLARTVAQKSKDGSTKVGAVVVGPGKEIRSTGFNGMPRGVNDDVAARHQRPEKYFWFEHAERNAIYNAARHGASLEGCTLYCEMTPCVDCARAIIQAGISRVVIGQGELKGDPAKWAESWERSRIMFEEAGVAVVFFTATA